MFFQKASHRQSGAFFLLVCYHNLLPLLLAASYLSSLLMPIQVSAASVCASSGNYPDCTFDHSLWNCREETSAHSLTRCVNSSLNKFYSADRKGQPLEMYCAVGSDGTKICDVDPGVGGDDESCYRISREVIVKCISVTSKKSRCREQRCVLGSVCGCLGYQGR